MTFYGILLKIIHSYFSLVWRRGNKSQMWSALIRFTHCLITLVSITLALPWVFHILVKKKKWQMNTPAEKGKPFPTGNTTMLSVCLRSEVNNGKYFPVSNTLSKALCDSPRWPTWASVQWGRQKFEFESILAPHSNSTLLQPMYKADHKLLEVMTAFYFSGCLKCTAGGKKSFSCLTLFYCVPHKMPKLEFFPSTSS